jgi:hypothetical protein
MRPAGAGVQASRLPRPRQGQDPRGHTLRIPSQRLDPARGPGGPSRAGLSKLPAPENEYFCNILDFQAFNDYVDLI